MLNVTGQRSKSRPTKSVAFSPAVFTGNELQDPTNVINRREISGKRRGALVLVEAADNKFIPYVALGDKPSDSWVPYFVEQGGGGGGGAGITRLATSEDDRAITFIDENGRPGKLMYCDIKATPMEFYLDVRSYDTSKAIYMDVKQGVEYTIPIGSVSMSGRNHHITIDSATNRILLPAGGLRGTLRIYGAYRFPSSVKDDMNLEVLWYCRKQGSSEAWELIQKGNVSRTASQTTSALSFPSSSVYYNLPSDALEVEVRLKFNNIGSTGIDWKSLPLFNSEDDGFKISMLKNPNFDYVT